MVALGHCQDEVLASNGGEIQEELEILATAAAQRAQFQQGQQQSRRLEVGTEDKETCKAKGLLADVKGAGYTYYYSPARGGCIKTSA